MGTQPVSESEFNVLQFEKQLTTLKDSQEAINNCCQWCLQNRPHHKKIVNSWLNVLKRVKVEQRLILFYLANDVVQYSKRRNYEYVESWGTALQKATTMVRDEKVKHKILRIFKIWEQRNVYNEEFISDLCGLLSVQPSGTKSDEPHEFQPTYVINKIKSCAKLERDTDAKLKLLKEHNPKIQIDDGLIGSLKDRAHVDDVEKEVEVYVKHMEDYINALKLEIKNRITLIGVLKQAEAQLEADRKDVKVVANAYKMFGTRVKTFQRKLDEHKATLSSPIPSPDINAPSPSPDSDIDLPDDIVIHSPIKEEVAQDYNPKAELEQQQQQQQQQQSVFPNAGYYTPTTTNDSSVTTNSFHTNGFASFIGSDLSFNLDNLDTASLFNANTHTTTASSESTVNFAAPLQNPPLPVEPPAATAATTNYSFGTGHQLPLMPPPVPPFNKSEPDYGADFGQNYSTTSNISSYDTLSYSSATTTVFKPTIPFSSSTPSVAPFLEESYEPPVGANPYPPANGNEEYNPEEGMSSWEQDDTTRWNSTTVSAVETLDTPESPPIFEKEGYGDPIEYHDVTGGTTGAADIDHRVVPSIAGDLEDSLGSLGGKDVNHRNLISLTGSPSNSNSNITATEITWNNQNADQDYRVLPPSISASITQADQDYRMGFNIEQLKLPPPPPPPSKFHEPVEESVLNSIRSRSPKRGTTDNVDSIDMDLSDEDVIQQKQNDNLKVIIDPASENRKQFCLEPPPPLPDLPDDVDANNFLDDLSNDLHEFTNLSDELTNSNNGVVDSNINENRRKDLNIGPAMLNPVLPPNSLPESSNIWSQPPLLPPIPFGEMVPAPPMPPMGAMLGLPPPNTLTGPPGLLPPPRPWLGEGDKNLWLYDDASIEDEVYQQWMGPPSGMFNFRSRGNNRGNFVKRGWSRGGNFGRGVHNFRGGNPNFRGGQRGNRGQWSKGSFRGNFRGGF